MTEQQTPASPATQRRFALVVDNPRRDLSGLVLVARELALRGHSVYLVPMNLRYRELPALAPDHVGVNYLRRTNDEHIGRLMDAGIGVTILDTEGAVFQEVEALVVKMSRRTDVTSRIHAYCSWGTFMADFLGSQGFFRRDQIVVTGPPRMDFYAAPWRKAAEACSPAARLPDGPMVLICGSFPFANPEFRDPEELIAMRISNTGFSEEHVRMEYEKDRAGLDGFIEMSISLARRLPDTQFVYRPHPFERASTYDDHFRGFDNISVIGDGPVDGWVLRATAVIQPSDCTTGVEAAFASVPALVPGWIHGDRVPVVEAVSTVCSNVEELAAEVSGALRGPDTLVEGAGDLVESLFGPQDGMAHHRVADVLEASGTGSRGLDDSLLRHLHYHPTTDAGGLAKLLSTIRERVGMPALWSVRTRSQRPPWKWDRSEKFFGPEGVNTLLQALDSASPDDRGAVTAESAPVSDYRYGFAVGRSVLIGPPSI